MSGPGSQAPRNDPDRDVPVRHESAWLATTEERGFGRLEAPIAVDVAVLGGGIAGLTTALLLKNAGLRVAVLEAGTVCAATTGHTTAKVSAQHGLIYDTLRSKFGKDGARAYADANLAAIELVEALVREHGIGCDWERRPAYAYTEQDSQVTRIEKEVEAAREAGLPASYTVDTDLPWEVKAAVRFDDQAQFHPRRYCLALAGLIDGDGSHVFEWTRALDVDDGSPCVVKSERHDVRAAFVVLATHLPFLDRGAFFAKCHPEREYVLAMALEQPVPRGMYISVEQPTRSVRQHPFQGGELLILSGDSHKTGRDDDTERHYAALKGFARQRFAVASIDYRWSTQDYMPVDQLPYIGRLRRTSNRLYVATGFRKWGMTSGTVAGVVISDQILGRENPWSELFNPNRVKPLTSAREFVRENANVARRFVGDRVTKRGSGSVEELPPGEGQVITVGGKQVAVSRDPEAQFHAVSARCTHMGCIVDWNRAERTWDCPCHGSRFGVDGEVLEGPAVKELERRDVPVHSLTMSRLQRVGRSSRRALPFVAAGVGFFALVGAAATRSKAVATAWSKVSPFATPGLKAGRRGYRLHAPHRPRAPGHQGRWHWGAKAGPGPLRHRRKFRFWERFS